MRIVILVCISFFSAVDVFGQPADRLISQQEYIELYKDEAIKEMIRSGVPASITLAQGILESASGNSPLAKYGKNHFGIKCHSDWTGPSMRLDDDRKNECFRKYKTVLQSYQDHSDFLAGKKRYEELFKLKPTDYKGWAKGLKKAGYATNPKYADLLIELIEKYELHQFDRYGKVPPRTPKLDGPKALAVRKQKRVVKIHNNHIRYTVVKTGDTFYKIANDFEMALWQILKYNDLNKTDILHPGDVIYLQPKRKKAKQKWHVVKAGETMRDISQEYGIKLKTLYKKNNMIQGTEPNAGQKLSLRKRINN